MNPSYVPCRWQQSGLPYRTAIAFFLGLLLLGLTAAAQVPVVFKVSEGVRPDAVLSLHGEYLTGVRSVRFLKADGSVAATQAAVQTDRDGHFCRVIFPSIAPGAYQLAVRNGDGWSTQAICVNRAEPRWISEERAYPGMALKLIGRNLDAAEYGGRRRTQVRLAPVEGGVPVVLEPDAVNPYCVDFSVPAGVAAGKYYVEVGTNSAVFGRDWVRLNDHSEFPDTVRDTAVQVERPPADRMALALKVAWANDFNWSHVADAKRDFQANGDGVTDDTRAIQNALEHVSRNDGGVVFLPNGVYNVSSLVIPSRCILQGESRDKTIVMVSKSGDDGEIVLKGTALGISTLTLKYQPTVPAHSQGMLLAGTACKLFIYNTRFDLLRKPDVSVQQSPYYFSGSGPMLVARCQFYLSSRNLWDHAVRNRVTFRDNFIDMHDGLGLCMSAEKLLLLDNELTFHPAAYAGQMNGFFLNEGWMGWNIYNAYIAGNNAHDLNGPGDCQPYAADSAWSCFAGVVTGASANSANVRVDVGSDIKGLDTHEMELLVVQGKGLGQIRRMSAHRNLGGSPAVVRCTVSPPWDVPPDATSVITVGSWHVNNVFYRNTARGSKSPYNMYYGGCYDCVDAESTSDNTEGWYNWGRIGEMQQGAWHCPVYFNQLRRSTFAGLSPTYATMGITLRVENETKSYRGIGDYGTEIRDNTIDRAACSNKNQRLAGNAAIATFNQSWTKVTPQTPLIFATLCEGNRIKNSSVGFDLNGSFSFAIRGTSYENCSRAVNDHGYDTALLPGKPPEYSHPVGAATGDLAGHKFLVTSVRTGDTEVFLVDPTTGDATNLSRSPKSEDRYPCWSPDGNRVAFISDRAGGANLFVMDADGGNVKQLTHTTAVCYMPSWVGDRIVMGMHGQQPEMASLRDDGADLKMLGEGHDPCLSPDGKRIVYTGQVLGGVAVFVMDADGSNKRQLVGEANPWGAIFPAWSPDGKQIVYSFKAGDALELFLIDADGSNRRQLTHLGKVATPAAWSPDGKWISFRLTNERYWSNPARMKQIYLDKPGDKRPVWVIRPDGREAHVIEPLRYQCAMDGSRAAWKPLGSLKFEDKQLK